jgi:hypothetical protein
LSVCPENSLVESANKTDYIYVVESYRDDNGNINHRHLFSPDRLKDFIPTPIFKKLAQKALASDQTLDMGGVDLSCLSEGEVLKYGHFVGKRGDHLPARGVMRLN